MQLRLKTILILLFVLSGAAGLIYQVVWFKQLSYFIGNSTSAQSILLATYMGGLAIGAYWWGKRSSKEKSLKTFARLELAIGVYCLLFPWFFDLSESIFIALVQSLEVSSDSISVQLMRFVISVLLILPPTVMMGGTLPLLVSHLSDKLGDVVRNVSILYFINSLGAVLGSLLCGFYLLETLGLRYSLYVGIVLDIIVFAWAIYLDRKNKETNSLKVEEKIITRDETRSIFEINSSQYKVVLWTAAISGFAAMAYEIIWLRLLIPILSSSTYSFTIILASFITGITIGSYLVYRYSHKIKNAYRLIGISQLVIVLSLVASLPLYERLPFFIWNSIGDPELNDHSYGFYLFIQLFYVFLILIIPTICMGISLPIAGRLIIKDVNQSGAGVGRVFSINTLGTVLGSLVTGLILIPLIGLFVTLILILSLNLFLALRILLEKNILSKNLKIYLTLTSVSILLISYTKTSQSNWIYTIFLSETPRKVNRLVPPETYADFLEKSKMHDSLLFYMEGPNGTFIVAQNKNERYLFTNGKGDANSVGDLRTQISLGLTPLVLHENPEEIMVIGFGAGTTIGHAMSHPRVKRGVVAEISKEVIEASSHFNSINEKPLQRKNLEVIEDDGISALRLSQRKYDVIISQPSNPWSSGVGNLFTQEFFETCKQHLKKNGLVAQWFNLYEMDDKCLQLIMRTAQSKFKHITLWQIGTSDIMLLCSDEKQSIDLKKAQLNFELSKKNFSQIGIQNFAAFLSQQVLSSQESMIKYAGSGPLNTEDLPLLEHWAPVAYYYNSKPQNFYPIDERPRLDQHKDHLLTRYKQEQGGLTQDEILQIALFQSKGGNKEFAFNLAEQNPNVYLAWAKKADQLGNQKKKEEFENLAIKARLKSDPGAQNQHLNNSILLANSGKYNEALIEIDKALKEDATVAEYYFRKGTYLEGLNQLDPAIQNYSKAVELDKSFGDCFINLGIVYGKKRNLPKAIEMLNKAQVLMPYDPKVYFNRGNAKGLSGDWNGAILDLSKTIELKSNHGQAYLLRGTAYLQLSNRNAACSDFNKALQLGISGAAQYLQSYCR